MGSECIYALAREISRSVAFTAGAGSFMGREGEEKRRPRAGTLGGGGGPTSPFAARLLESSGCPHLPQGRPCIFAWLRKSTSGPHLLARLRRPAGPALVDRLQLLARLRRPSVVSLGLVAPCLLSASSRHRHPHLTCPSASSRRPQVHPHRTCPSASCLRLRLVCPLPPLCLWSPKGQLPSVYSCRVICSSCSAFALNIVCLVLCCSAFDLNIVCLMLCY